MKRGYAGWAAVGLVTGSLLFGSHDARAIFGIGDVVTDPGSYDVIGALQAAVTAAINNMANSIVNKVTDVGSLLDDKLTAGFTQLSNYAKAQVGAIQQVTDASNNAMATFQTELRDAQIRDDHTLSPEACVALDMGQTVTVAAGQAWRVRKAIDDITDRRGEALPGTPAYAGEGQAAAAITRLHWGRYCSENEAEAGICTSDPIKENLDQKASSLFGVAAYDPNGGVDAANDFGTNIIQPIVPAALRGDALTSVAGMDAEARRRSYNAKMSLARGVADDVIASRTNSTNLTDDEKQQQVNQGLPQTDQSSWFGALELEVNRRAGGVEWAAGLQAMGQKSVLVEIATELAMSNYIALANFKMAQQNAVVNASLLATAAQAELKPAASMPSPQIASQ